MSREKAMAYAVLAGMMTLWRCSGCRRWYGWYDLDRSLRVYSGQADYCGMPCEYTTVESLNAKDPT